MSESIDEFLARGGKITSVEDGKQTFKDEKALHRFQAKKKADENYAQHQMKNAENETDCRKPYYD